jgi:hypothetical protein
LQQPREARSGDVYGRTRARLLGAVIVAGCARIAANIHIASLPVFTVFVH